MCGIWHALTAHVAFLLKDLVCVADVCDAVASQKAHEDGILRCLTFVPQSDHIIGSKCLVHMYAQLSMKGSMASVWRHSS